MPFMQCLSYDVCNTLKVMSELIADIDNEKGE